MHLLFIITLQLVIIFRYIVERVKYIKNKSLNIYTLILIILFKLYIEYNRNEKIRKFFFIWKTFRLYPHLSK